MLQQSPPPLPSGAVEPQPPPPDASPAERWQRGQLLVVRGDRWRLEARQLFADCALLSLAGASRNNRRHHLDVLCPFDRPRAERAALRLRPVGRQRCRVALGAALAGTTPFGRLRTAARAAILLHDYQLAPALAVLNGHATRLLLADAVGLGKTIQAGLVLSELRAIGQATRTLVLVPAGLRDQWRSELGERFSIDATVAEANSVRRALSRVASGTNPWSTWPVVIASLDFVKRPEVHRALEPLTWDLLVVDEAHACALAPERSTAVRALAARARHVVLMTATPHAGDDRAFASLCTIGQSGPADALVMFRRSRSDVGLSSNRRVHLLRVRPTGAERRMEQVLDRYACAVWNAPNASADARLAVIVLRKRGLSSAFSLARSVERRRQALFDAPPAALQLALPFPGQADEDDQTPEDDDPIDRFGAPGMEPARERQWLTRLLDASRLAAEDESKVRRLARLLARAGEPAIVFTEYRDTARHLAAVLEPLGPVAVLHGGLSRTERQEVERTFRSGAARLLVATDAAGEGLNLQHNCRLVINLELPWNPMRLEQRIGRVDRIGQARRPHAVHLVGRATAEERIVARLVVRQRRAQQVLGGDTDAIGASERDVETAVMTGNIQHTRERGRRGPACTTDSTLADDLRHNSQVPVRTVDLADLCRAETARLLTVRRLRAARWDSSRDVIPPGTAWLAQRDRRHPLRMLPAAARPPHVRPASPSLVCLFVVRAVDAREELLEEMIVPMHVALTVPPRDIDRSALASLVLSPVLRDWAASWAAERLATLAACYRQRLSAAIARERGLAVHGALPRAVQAGMFDRRALERAEQERALELLHEREHQQRLLDLTAAGSRVSVADPELLLVLL